MITHHDKLLLLSVIRAEIQFATSGQRIEDMLMRDAVVAAFTAVDGPEPVVLSDAEIEEEAQAVAEAIGSNLYRDSYGQPALQRGATVEALTRFGRRLIGRQA